MNGSPDALPPPEVYARLPFEARGAICAGLTVAGVKAYAEQYAAWLTHEFGTPVEPSDVSSRMFLCAIGWRGMQQEAQR